MSGLNLTQEEFTKAIWAPLLELLAKLYQDAYQAGWDAAMAKHGKGE